MDSLSFNLSFANNNNAAISNSNYVNSVSEKASSHLEFKRIHLEAIKLFDNLNKAESYLKEKNYEFAYLLASSVLVECPHSSRAEKIYKKAYKSLQKTEFTPPIMPYEDFSKVKGDSVLENKAVFYTNMAIKGLIRQFESSHDFLGVCLNADKLSADPNLHERERKMARKIKWKAFEHLRALAMAEKSLQLKNYGAAYGWAFSLLVERPNHNRANKICEIAKSGLFSSEEEAEQSG